MIKIKSNCIMLKVLKYVVDMTNTPILFNPNKLHNSVRDEAISAGYLYLRYNQNSGNCFVVGCFGESTTLNVKSNPILDKKLIEEYIKNTSQNVATIFFEN